MLRFQVARTCTLARLQIIKYILNVHHRKIKFLNYMKKQGN